MQILRVEHVNYVNGQQKVAQSCGSLDILNNTHTHTHTHTQVALPALAFIKEHALARVFIKVFLAFLQERPCCFLTPYWNEHDAAMLYPIRSNTN